MCSLRCRCPNHVPPARTPMLLSTTQNGGNYFRILGFFVDKFHKNFGDWLTLVEGFLALTKAIRLLERPSHLTQNTARPERFSAKDNKKQDRKLQWATKVLRHFVILE